MNTKPKAALVTLALLVSLGATPALAQGPELTLDAASSAELDNDEMSVVLAVQKQGGNVQELSQLVLSTLQRSIAKARKVEGVTAKMGTVNTYPVWDNKGKTSNWTVRADISLKGTNFSGLALLASELTSEMQLTGVSFSLSPAKREAEEAKLIIEVASAYKSKAKQLAQAMGYSTFELRSLGFNREAPNAGYRAPPRPEMRIMAMADAAVPVPTEGGKSEVRVSLNGSVELK